MQNLLNSRVSTEHIVPDYGVRNSSLTIHELPGDLLNFSFASASPISFSVNASIGCSCKLIYKLLFSWAVKVLMVVG